MDDVSAERVVVGRSSSARGEVVLVRRGDVDELVVNGAFAMDSTETRSEVELGRLAAGSGRVLVGGLGLGYTVAAVLAEADRRVDGPGVTVDVVELEDALVGWAREGRTPTLGRVARDPRVRLHAGDVGAVLAAAAGAAGVEGPSGPWDAVLLDVDNGPDFLIHAPNRALYAAPGLRAAYGCLAPGGLLAIWCQAPSAPLLEALRTLDESAEQRTYAVERGRRTFTYAIATVRRPHA